MKFNVNCRLDYTVTEPSTFIFNIGVVQYQHQQILSESLQFDPEISYEDYYSATPKNHYHRLHVLPGPLSVSYQAAIALSPIAMASEAIEEIPVNRLPPDTIQYLYPSRYCQSDRLMNLAHNLFMDLVPGYSRVQGICNWIYDNVTYRSGSSDAHTSAYDTVTERQGVCRDFAHLGIALCRALNIPARFVSGYAYGLQPPDFHAYFEAYLGDRWYVFDATRQVPLEGLIRISTGRDAAETSFATIFGAAQMESMTLEVNHLPDDEAAASSPPSMTEQAIAL